MAYEGMIKEHLKKTVEQLLEENHHMGLDLEMARSICIEYTFPFREQLLLRKPTMNLRGFCATFHSEDTAKEFLAHYIAMNQMRAGGTTAPQHATATA